MANSTKIIFQYTCEDGKTHDFGFSYADAEAETSTVRALNTAILTNGSIFEYTPVTLERAYIKEVTESEYDFS